VPTRTFGIPGSNSTAVLLGGFLIHGLQPGPLLFEREPEFIYGLYGGLAVANLSLAVLGILVLTPCLWLVSRPKPYLLAGIYALIFSGVYWINHSLFDLWIVLAAGVLGYGLRWFGFPFLPLVLGVILGHMIESNYRRSLVLSRGDHMIFLQDPVAAGLLAAAVLFVIGSLVRNWYGARRRKDARMTAAGG
jgi:putative tricarboxylic transport membrane protein